jgi:hypothetical protein
MTVIGRQLNPFSGYGSVAIGERFIGRTDLLDELIQTVGCGLASRAVVGLPRVGKTSLATAFGRGLDARDVTFGWLDVSTISTESSLLTSIASKLMLGSAWDTDEDAYESLKEHLRGSALPSVLVLDEFDSVRRTREADTNIRRLREIISSPHHFGLSLLLLSRRRTSVIETAIPDLSTLSGVCPTLFVKPFSREESEAMIARGWVEGLPEVARRDVLRLSGGHPMLLEMFLFHLFQSGDLEQCVERTAVPRDELFCQFQHLLEEDDMWSEVLRLAKAVPGGWEKQLVLKHYGLIDRDRRREWRFFSQQFADFADEAARAQGEVWKPVP